MGSVVRSLKIQACYLMFWQLLILAVAALLTLWVKDRLNGLSVLLGGLCYWLPTLVFALYLFSITGARAAKRFILVFFVGEMFKLLISAIVFVLVVKHLDLNVLAMMMGYIVAIIAFWLVFGLGLDRMNGIKRE